MTKEEKIYLSISILSILSLMAAFILGYFRTELFGVIKGYAPHNYGFNMICFLPLILLSLSFAFVSLIWLSNQWKNRQNRKLKWVIMILSMPAVCIFLYVIIGIFMILRQH